MNEIERNDIHIGKEAYRMVKKDLLQQMVETLDEAVRTIKQLKAAGQKKWLSPTEAGEILGISRHSVVKLYESGILKGKRTSGGFYKIDRESLYKVDL